MTEALLAPAPGGLAPGRIVDFDIYHPFKGQADLHVAWMALRDSSPRSIVWNEVVPVFWRGS